MWEGSEVYECRQCVNAGIFSNKIILCNNQIWQTHIKSSDTLYFHALVNSHPVMNEFKYRSEHQPLERWLQKTAYYHGKNCTALETFHAEINLIPISLGQCIQAMKLAWNRFCTVADSYFKTHKWAIIWSNTLLIWRD